MKFYEISSNDTSDHTDHNECKYPLSRYTAESR